MRMHYRRGLTTSRLHCVASPESFGGKGIYLPPGLFTDTRAASSVRASRALTFSDLPLSDLLTTNNSFAYP